MNLNQLLTALSLAIRIQPLAIEAYIQLLRAQVPLAIVLNMIPSNSPDKTWMKTYLQGIDRFLRLSYQGEDSTLQCISSVLLTTPSHV